MTFAKGKTAHVYIRVTDMKDNTIKLSDLKYIDDYVYEHIKNYTINASDLYLTIAGTIGSVGIVPNEVDGMNLTENAAKLTQIGCIKEYLLYALLSTIAQEHFISRFHQVAQPKLSIETASKTPIAMPPIGEQNRIVKEIKRYLAAIKIIEEGQSDLETTISQAKSKILDLAIHGKLVPQDPTDEPACKLLKRINPKAEIACDNGHYQKLPEGWCLCLLNDVLKEVFAGGDKPLIFSKNKNEENYIPIYANGTENKGLFGFTNKAQVYERCLTISARGTIGFTCIREVPFVPIVRLITAIPLPVINLLFLKHQIDTMLSYTEGSSIPQLTIPTIKRMLIILPPLKEQLRIVAKIEELFALLDTIKAQL